MLAAAHLLGMINLFGLYPGWRRHLQSGVPTDFCSRQNGSSHDLLNQVGAAAAADLFSICLEHFQGCLVSCLHIKPVSVAIHLRHGPLSGLQHPGTSLRIRL